MSARIITLAASSEKLTELIFFSVADCMSFTGALSAQCRHLHVRVAGFFEWS